MLPQAPGSTGSHPGAPAPVGWPPHSPDDAGAHISVFFLQESSTTSSGYPWPAATSPSASTPMPTLPMTSSCTTSASRRRMSSSRSAPAAWWHAGLVAEKPLAARPGPCGSALGGGEGGRGRGWRRPDVALVGPACLCSSSECPSSLPFFPDTPDSPSPRDGPAPHLTLSQSLDSPHLAQNQWGSEWQGVTQGSAGGPPPPDLGQILCQVREQQSHGVWTSLPSWTPHSVSQPGSTSRCDSP